MIVAKHGRPKSDESVCDVLKGAREAVKPIFDERRQIEEQECPARLSVLQAAHVSIKYAGGDCPVQIEGHVKGQPFYFRARGESWSLGIGGDPVCEPEFYTEGDYGNWPDAGWMPLHEAYDFLIAGIGEWQPKLAQAMEARRAETIGSVHDSAVRQDAPIPEDSHG